MLYVLHGEAEYSLRQALDGLTAKLGDASTADLNTTVLDGRSVAFDELRTTCDTMPFLAERRLVIVEGLLARYEPRSGLVEGGKQRGDPIESGLRSYLPTLPESALLVFVERVTLSEKNPLLRMMKDAGAKIQEFTPPSGYELTAWINKRVRASSGAISARAAETLGAFVGGNLRQLSQEIDKLLTYSNGREIQDGDVQLLVADARELKVWTLTDAVAARQRDRAVGALHQMLDDGEQPLMLLAMITRQFRSLVQVKELADAGMSADQLAAQLRLNPFVAKNAVGAARGFSNERLDAIYHHLLDTDLAVKTGWLEPALALDLLVIELTTPANERRS